MNKQVSRNENLVAKTGVLAVCISKEKETKRRNQTLLETQVLCRRSHSVEKWYVVSLLGIER